VIFNILIHIQQSAAARLLRSWFRIPLGAWIFVCCECCVLSGRGLCDELVTRPEESYRLWCVVVCDLETSRMRRPWPALGRSATAKKIYIYIQQDATLHRLFYLKTALHVSGGTITHHQERKQRYLQHLVFVTSLLLSAAFVEEMELVWVCCGWCTPPTAHSNQFQLFHDSGR